MFPPISETRLNGQTLGSSSILFTSLSLANKPRHSLTEEEQHLYNHHIIENFVESVREMNDVVLIPSKLKDLDSSPPPGMPLKKLVILNDDLHTYYEMINIVKNDLFEPHNAEAKNNYFLPGAAAVARSRKISRQHRREAQEAAGLAGHQRNQSTSSLSSYVNGLSSNGTPAANGNGSTTPPSEEVLNNGNNNNNGTTTTNGMLTPPEDVGLNGQALVPLTSEQLIGQSSKQLTVQFVHHLRSLYTILEHFTGAADFITERYTLEVDAV